MIHVMTLGLTCMLLIACSASVPSELPDTSPPSPSGQQSVSSQTAYDRIMVAERFMSDSVGYGGNTPDVVIALRRLAREPDAARAFAKLEEQATMSGRLYALCGL